MYLYVIILHYYVIINFYFPFIRTTAETFNLKQTNKQLSKSIFGDTSHCFSLTVFFIASNAVGNNRRLKRYVSTTL